MADPERNKQNPWELCPTDPSRPIPEDDRVNAVLETVFGLSLEEIMNDPVLLRKILVAWYGDEDGSEK